MKKSFKRFAAILLGLALLATSATAAFADDVNGEYKSVTFNGDSLTASYTDKGVASELFNMQPGDTTTIEVDLVNNVSSSATWYLNNQVLKSLESSEAGVAAKASGGAYTYRLTYNPDQPDEDILFESERLGGTATNTTTRAGGAANGLDEVNGALEGYRFLSTLGAGAHAKVRLEVMLDGEAQGNDYQNTLANLQLLFAVDPVTAINRNQTVTNTVNRDVTTVVQTGEGSSNLPFVLATGISGLLFLLLGLLGLMDGRKAKKVAQKALCLAMALTLACAAPAMLGNVARADAPAYYTVRIFAGARGVFKDTIAKAFGGTLSDDKTVLTIQVPVTKEPQRLLMTDFNNGANSHVNVTESKYYVRGLREAGADNDDALADLSVMITEDKDFVVAYGVEGNMIGYTVRYLDAAGKVLYEEEKLTGKIGEQVRVPYRNIDGYLPQAYNLRMVLKENAAENIFTFYYNPLPENLTTTTVTQLVGGGVVVIPGAAPAGGGGAPAGPGGVVVPEEETPLAPPEEVIDLDNPDTPQAGPGESSGLEDLIDNATPLSGLPMAAKVGIGVAAAAVLGGAAFLIVKKRKKNNAEAS